MSSIPQISSERIDKDLYIIKDSQNHILAYAPLRQKVFPIFNEEGSNRLKAFFNNQADPEMEKFLEEEGLLESPKGFSPNRPENYEPINLTLSLTSDCNLRCKYCYAYAGDIKKNLSWGKIEAAIHLSIEASKKLKKKTFKTVFHGGGEPTLRWKEIQKATELIKKLWLGEKYFSIVTNATLITDEKAKWLKENNFRISVSLDGPKDVHDQQRVKRDGTGSFDECILGVSHLYSHQVNFGIRATITKNNIGRIKELLLIAKAFECGLKIEPLTITGRASEEMSAISYEDYYMAFNDAKVFAEKLDVSFGSTYSLKLYTRASFCAGNGNLFCILPGGLISTCTRTTRIEDELSDDFIIGHINGKNELVYNAQKVHTLKSMTITSFDQCRECFAKWYCVGGCLHQRISNNNEMPRGHCDLMQAMLFNSLFDKLES